MMKRRRNSSCRIVGRKENVSYGSLDTAAGSSANLPCSRRDAARQAADFATAARREPAADQQAETIDLIGSGRGIFTLATLAQAAV
jgi:hypothetical protein